MKIQIEKIIPDFLLKIFRTFKSYTVKKTKQKVERLRLYFSMTSDYKTALLIGSRIKKNEYRRTKKNSTAGIIHDIVKYKALHKELFSK